MIGRIFRVVRTPITLLILFGVLLYGARWGYTNILRPIPPLPPDPCVSQSVPGGQLKSSQVVVRVYNGGDRKGLAADVGRSLRTKGFRVTLTTNTGEVFEVTTKYFGYYRFSSIPAGSDYVFTVSDKHYDFPTRIVSVRGDMEGFDFIAIAKNR